MVTKPSSRDVAIVGGGYAGMAAAVALTERGARVTVYEAARDLGGRARRVITDDVALDNGQHILIGAYRETMRMASHVGVPSGAFLRLPLQWLFPPHFRFRVLDLGAPWHVAFGLLCAHGLSASSRLRCALFFQRCARQSFRLAEDMPVSELLRVHAQLPDAVRFLWHPLCIAALNTPPEQASGQVFLNVLRDGLAANRHASDLILPRVDLTRLFPQAAADHIVPRGATIKIAHAVQGIERHAGGFLLTTSAGQAQHRAVILATQPYRIAALAGHLRELSAPLAAIAELTYQSIVTVYLRFARAPALPFPLLGMSGRYGQWLFDRAQISAQPGMLAVVISAHAREQRLHHDLLAERVAGEVAAMLPSLGALQWSQVIEEKRATFACVPAMRRPDQRTELPGLFLAGDYTASEYPATLESAVRSGIRCAELAAAFVD